jgi:hypothetical protein
MLCEIKSATSPLNSLSPKRCPFERPLFVTFRVKADSENNFWATPLKIAAATFNRRQPGFVSGFNKA